jgi:hypothetical protein|tara:strand:- start:162 stop:416 length:255 start_codon:yes stop_codon:yes gene_type:complete
MSANPMYRKMLKSFVDQLERRESSSGWVIVSKPSYETSNVRKEHRKERPPNSTRQTFKIYAEWMEMGEKDLQFEIDSFLKTWEE